MSPVTWVKTRESRFAPVPFGAGNLNVQTAVRQVAVLARATTGDLAGAPALREDTEPGDPREGAVAAVLTVPCHPGESRWNLREVPDGSGAVAVSGGV